MNVDQKLKLYFKYVIRNTKNKYDFFDSFFLFKTLNFEIILNRIFITCTIKSKTSKSTIKSKSTTTGSTHSKIGI